MVAKRTADAYNRTSAVEQDARRPAPPPALAISDDAFVAPSKSTPPPLRNAPLRDFLVRINVRMESPISPDYRRTPTKRSVNVYFSRLAVTIKLFRNVHRFLTLYFRRRRRLVLELGDVFKKNSPKSLKFDKLAFFLKSFPVYTHLARFARSSLLSFAEDDVPLRAAAPRRLT